MEIESGGGVKHTGRTPETQVCAEKKQTQNTIIECGGNNYDMVMKFTGLVWWWWWLGLAKSQSKKWFRK